MWCVEKQLSVLAILLASACGGSAKPAPAPAANATPEPTVAPSDEPKPGDLGPKPIAQEEPVSESTAPECRTNKDCTIFADCCTCKGVPLAGKPPVPCDAVCGESKCEVKGKTLDNVACVDGRCKLK